MDSKISDAHRRGAMGVHWHHCSVNDHPTLPTDPFADGPQANGPLAYSDCRHCFAVSSMYFGFA